MYLRSQFRFVGNWLEGNTWTFDNGRVNGNKRERCGSDDTNHYRFCVFLHDYSILLYQVRISSQFESIVPTQDPFPDAMARFLLCIHYYR